MLLGIPPFRNLTSFDAFTDSAESLAGRANRSPGLGS
jgi:hypothetical protein